MAKEQAIEAEGIIKETLPNAVLRLKLEIISMKYWLM